MNEWVDGGMDGCMEGWDGRGQPINSTQREYTASNLRHAAEGALYLPPASPQGSNRMHGAFPWPGLNRVIIIALLGHTAGWAG